MWVRGLKLAIFLATAIDKMSHPMWVRGLKLKLLGYGFITDSRTLCGCVD